jgi:hypothetical protein
LFEREAPLPFLDDNQTKPKAWQPLAGRLSEARAIPPVQSQKRIPSQRDGSPMEKSPLRRELTVAAIPLGSMDKYSVLPVVSPAAQPTG